MKFPVPRVLRSKQIFLIVFPGVVLFLNLTPAFGQGGESQPVARLISGSVVSAASRPRRAETSVNVPSGPLLNEATMIERTAFDKTNNARVQNGLLPLTWDPVLCLMARMHSKEMAERGYFAHETPEGLEPRDRARALGIPRFRVLAENIAYNKGFEDPGAFAVERWMISAGHRANILYIGFQTSAIGSYVAADGSVYLTQVFLTR